MENKGKIKEAIVEPQLPFEFIEFVSNIKGIVLLEHKEYETGEYLHNNKKINLIELILNNTNDTVEFAVTTTFYDKDNVIVGNSVFASPKIRPARSWKMIESEYVRISATKYDVECGEF